jgi:hypothetical protein
LNLRLIANLNGFVVVVKQGMHINFRNGDPCSH